jgi:hypothetical protein
MYLDWTLAVVHCGLLNHERAWHHLAASHQAVQVPSSIPRMLVVAAVLLGQAGNYAEATRLLGSVMHDRHSAHGWMAQWRPLADLRAKLQAQLGPASYQEALDLGAKLDAERLADELLGRSDT